MYLLPAKTARLHEVEALQKCVQQQKEEREMTQKRLDEAEVMLMQLEMQLVTVAEEAKQHQARSQAAAEKGELEHNIAYRLFITVDISWFVSCDPLFGLIISMILCTCEAILNEYSSCLASMQNYNYL